MVGSGPLRSAALLPWVSINPESNIQDSIRRLEEEIENLEGAVRALTIIAHQADDLRWSRERRAKLDRLQRSTGAGGCQPLEFRSQLLEMGDQIRQEVPGPGRSGSYRSTRSVISTTVSPFPTMPILWSSNAAMRITLPLRGRHYRKPCDDWRPSHRLLTVSTPWF